MFAIMAGNAIAQTSSGTITGTVHDVIPQIETGVKVQLLEMNSHAVIQESSVNPDGSFYLRDVPFGIYTLRITYDSDVLAAREVYVRTAVPIFVNIVKLSEYRTPEVVVTANRSQIMDFQQGSRTIFTAKSIDNLPLAIGNKKIETILLNTPGVVPDEDGRLHVRGEDAQLQYVVDGIPITENMTRVYSSLFNAGLIKAVNVQTGSLPAEYGIEASAVLAITTKSGFDKPLFANAGASYGSFNSRSANIEIGGNVNERTAAYFNFNTFSTNRYLDPITEGQPNHDNGSSYNYFGKFTTFLEQNVSLDLISMYNETYYQIPNALYKIPEQNQVQNLDDYLIGVRLNATLSDNSLLSLVTYHRRAQARITSGGLIQLTQADYAEAIAQNERYFIGGDRVDQMTGFQAEFSAKSQWMGTLNDFKSGIGVQIYPLSEFFTFAVTNPLLSDSTSPIGDSRFLPYDITKGGKPFLVNQSRTGHNYFVYAQDEFNLNRWIFNVGMRFDAFNLFLNESAFSPRLNITYSVNPHLALSFSYNRIVMQAPVENILVSSSEQARQLSGIQQGNVPTEVRSERSHVIQLAGTYKINSNLSFDLTGYGKYISDFLVEVELGNSGVIFPVNLKKGFVVGGEFRSVLHDWNGFYASLSLSTCVSRGIVPGDGSSPIAAGLIIGEEGKNYSHPFSGEDTFPTEHNQLFTAVLNLGYRGSKGFFASVDGRLDSGLPFDLVGPDGRGLDAEQSRQLLLARGYSERVINLLNLTPESPGSPDKSVAPHAVVDAMAGYDFSQMLNAPVTFTVSVLNVFDTLFLYKFESTFGATHFGYPRMINITMSVKV
ncbi:MAG: TonB-dependent receptor [Candidatus Kryptoniota bacterium]